MDNSIIGKKVQIVGKHPRKDEIGIVARAEKTVAGWGLRVELVSGEACFVFKPENLKVL